MTCDSDEYDAVCETFGHPTTDPATSPSVATTAGAGHPLFDGPIGAVAAIVMSGTMGYFSDTTGATVLGEANQAGTVCDLAMSGEGAPSHKPVTAQSDTMPTCGTS